MNRSRFISVLSLWLLTLSFGWTGPDKKVVILGIDALDPVLLRRFAGEGILPHFTKLIDTGDFKPLETMMAPQSPVAWSTFITGMDPGGHGIYDFIHRDPETMLPQFSMSKAHPAEDRLAVGSWVLPVSGRVELLRKGKAFWEVLGEHGVSTTVFRMPVNFPPVEAPRHHALSGMGTPDILGTPGTFSFFTERLPPNTGQFTGGQAHRVVVRDERVSAKLTGPQNPYRRLPGKPRGSRNGKLARAHPNMTVDFTVYIDPDSKAAKFVVGDVEFILKEKEWSDWVPITFEAVPWVVSIHSIGRFYLKQLDPHFELYVSPLQISPKNPAMPISHPKNWSEELCSCVGFFHTQGLPEDTKALTYGVFSGQDFWDQSMVIYEERVQALKYILENHRSDLMFFYFMTVDQGCHMLWRYMDEKHPFFVKDGLLRHGIRDLYRKMDEVVGYVMDTIARDTVLIVMSDHGFAPFYWGVNLNTWLWRQGYITRDMPPFGARDGYFSYVDWSKTKAYAVGLNGLYVNLKGREKDGVVDPADYDKLLDELERDLLALTDPRNGKRAVTLVTRSRRDFQGPYRNDGPDLIVGYSEGYRSSWESPLGKFPDEVFVDNSEAWSGDHCIDNRLVPGVLLTNCRISMERPALYDLTAAILDEFGVTPLPEMIGKDCIGERLSPAGPRDSKPAEK